MREAVDTFEDKVDEYAESIVNAVFPLSMGDVNPGATIVPYSPYNEAER